MQQHKQNACNFSITGPDGCICKYLHILGTEKIAGGVQNYAEISWWWRKWWVIRTWHRTQRSITVISHTNKL
jgi:hypothetical protein